MPICSVVCLFVLAGCARSRPPATPAPASSPAPPAEPDEIPPRLASALSELGYTMGTDATRARDGVTERLDLSAWTLGPGHGGSRILQVPREVDGTRAAPLVVGLPEADDDDPMAHPGPYEEVGLGPYGLELALGDARWMLEPGGRIVVWPAVEDACADDDEDCNNALTRVLSAERASLPDRRDETEPRSLTCTDGLWDCVAQQLGAEHALEFLGEVTVTNVDDSVEPPAWTLTRFAIRTPDGLPLAPGLVAEPPFTLIERGSAPIVHPFSLAVLDATSGLVTASSDLDGRALTVFAEPSAQWITVRPPAAPPFVVCHDEERGTHRIVQEEPTWQGSRVRTNTFYDVTTYVPTQEYTLTCEADLVIAAHVEGIRTGERDPGRAAPPPRDVTAFCADGSSCTDLWRGDLNADGTEDVVIERIGEMGCGDVTLYLSGGDGYAPATTWSWDC